MADVDFIRALLHSKYIDSHDIKPYTGLRTNNAGDILLTTPSLESYRVNNDPRYPYEKSTSARLPKGFDDRLLSYETLENRRYQSLGIPQPESRSVTRIFQERFGPAILPRSNPSRTIHTRTVPSYRLLVDQIPTSEQTMVSQHFNKLTPFVTEHGNNPNADPFLRQSIS